MGFVLRRLRKRAGLSQEAVAAALDINRGHLSELERGNYDPRSYKLVTLAEYLGCPAGEFFAQVRHRAVVYRRYASKRKH